MPTAARLEEVAHSVAELARRFLGSDVRVFWLGSWTEGRARPRSDIDIAVDAGRVIPPERITVFREAVEQLPTLYSVDLAGKIHPRAGHGRKPCIRGLRVTGGTIVGSIAAGHSKEEMLELHSYLEQR